MAQKYRKIADQLFSEKIHNDFPDWNMDDSNISTGKVILSNEGSVVSLLFDSNANVFYLESITIKATHTIIANNEELKTLYVALTKGGKI